MPIENPNQQPKAPNHTQDPSREKNEETVPAIVSVPPSRIPPDNPQATDASGDAYQEKNYRLNRWQFLVAISTLFVLAVYTSIAAYQACEMRKATNAATDSANAAQNAARTASDALNFTRQTEEPFVVLDSLNPANFPDGDGKAPGFVLLFRNYGRNPAVNIVGNATMTVGNVHGKNPKLDPVGNFRMEVIAAGSVGSRWIAVADLRFFEQHRELIKSGAEHFYIRGFFSWEDKAGKKFTKRDFCLVYNSNPARPSNIGIFDYCQ